ACGKRRRNLPNRQNERKIPRTDCCNYSNRSFDHEMSFSFHLVGNKSSVTAASFLGEPGQMIHSHRHFTLTLTERLAVLQRNEPRYFVATPMHFSGHLPQQLSALLSRQTAPHPERFVRMLYRLRDDRTVHLRHPCKHLAFGGIGDCIRFSCD